MLYLIILFLGGIGLLLCLISVQVLRIEKAITKLSEIVEEESLERIE